MGNLDTCGWVDTLDWSVGYFLPIYSIGFLVVPGTRIYRHHEVYGIPVGIILNTVLRIATYLLMHFKHLTGMYQDMSSIWEMYKIRRY